MSGRRSSRRIEAEAGGQRSAAGRTYERQQHDRAARTYSRHRGDEDHGGQGSLRITAGNPAASALNDNNNVINTMMSAIGIGRDSTRPREAAIVHAPAKRCRNDSAQATGRRTGIISSTHTANPSRVPSAMPFMMFYPFLLNHTSAWKTVPVYTRFDANSVLSKSTDQFDENHISSTMTCSAPPLAYHCISKSLILELLSCNTERAAGWNVF